MSPHTEAVSPTRLRLKVLAEEHLGDARLDDFELAIGEVLANAVLHGDRATPIDITVVTGDSVRVDVTSYGTNSAPLHADRRLQGGFGLDMVAQLADRWAFETNGFTRVMVCFGL